MSMIKAHDCFTLFQKCIADYHIHDDVDHPLENPYTSGGLDNLLYQKNWIDNVQWHLEDIIRLPSLEPNKGLLIKRRIDQSNQDRTDTVEQIDDIFVGFFKSVKPEKGCRLNSETPAWLLDRMSILSLKIFHMQEQVDRKEVLNDHLLKCQQKLSILLEQRRDMEQAFDELLEDIREGKRIFKVYRQMKMYNDASLNPMLYQTLSKK